MENTTYLKLNEADGFSSKIVTLFRFIWRKHLNVQFQRCQGSVNKVKTWNLIKTDNDASNVAKCETSPLN